MQLFRRNDGRPVSLDRAGRMHGHWLVPGLMGILIKNKNATIAVSAHVSDCERQGRAGLDMERRDVANQIARIIPQSSKFDIPDC